MDENEDQTNENCQIESQGLPKTSKLKSEHEEDACSDTHSLIEL